MQENQWPRNPVLTFWQSKRICSDNADAAHDRQSRVGINTLILYVRILGSSVYSQIGRGRGLRLLMARSGH